MSSISVPFPGAVALVTGASSGIGRATSIELYKAGWKVVLSGRRREELEKSMRMMQEAVGGGLGGDDKVGEGGSGLAPGMCCFPGDVSDKRSVSELFQMIKETYGHLDLLFNNAGVSGSSVPFEDLDLDDFEQCMNVNVTASVRCTQEAFKLMKSQSPQGGKIINNGSIAAYSPRPNATSYTISKHAISGLTKSASLDGRKYGISVAQIDIGNAATAMGSTHGQGEGALQADLTRKVEPTFDVKEVARAVAFMASIPRGGEVFNLTITANGMPFIGRG